MLNTPKWAFKSDNYCILICLYLLLASDDNLGTAQSSNRLMIQLETCVPFILIIYDTFGIHQMNASKYPYDGFIEDEYQCDTNNSKLLIPILK